MKCWKSLAFVSVILALTVASPLQPGTTTARSPTQIGETIKQLTDQLMETNATSPDIVTLDTRTPPKIKQHAKKKTKLPELAEDSHAGVAIPVDEEELLHEQTTKKLSYYKVDKPTTNSGLSTWILLSGQSTPKPSRKPVVKLNDGQNTTVVVEPNKVIKPIFKKRGTTTTTTVATTTKLTKVKASALAKKPTTSTTTTTVTVPTTIDTTVASEATTLPVEGKDSETDLTSDGKKTRRPSVKRKKNKNRRRRPSEKSDSSKLEKTTKTKEKPIGTQLYNYLSREVMPTVGVGLVGLMVTAGLAGYFLYPFGIARRSYEIDRKDTPHYYSDEYSGGIAEEEAIGKVIAGMPSNSLYGSNFKTPTSRHSFNNHKVIEQSTGYTVAEEQTPAVVPEHGPRRLNRRKKRDAPHSDADNEIGVSFDSTTTENSTQIPTRTTTTTQKSTKPDRVNSLANIFRELFHLKINLGLQLLQNATQAVSKYVSQVQKKLDKHYKTYGNYTVD